jgi:hypothetical protein
VRCAAVPVAHRVVFLIYIMELEVEELGIDPIVGPNVLLVAIEALPVAVVLVCLIRRKAANGLAAHCDSARHRRCWVVLGGVAVEPEVSEGSASTGGGVGGRPRVTGERLGAYL